MNDNKKEMENKTELETETTAAKGKGGKKRKLAIITALALAGTMMVGGTVAYLTDQERTANRFQVGKVTIDLTEPNWQEEENQKLEPSQIIKKDPTVTNTGANDAYVYLEVQVPMADVITAGADGTRENGGKPTHQQLFTFAANPNWTLLSKTELNANMVYTYSYDKILKPTEVTNTLCDTVTFANVVEGQIDENLYDIPVAAFAIQTVHTGNESGSIPEEAKAAYEKYVSQNTNQPGAVAK